MDAVSTSRSERQVVITGVGIVSPIGIGFDAFADALFNGRTGIGPLQAFDASTSPARIAAEIKDFNPKQYIKQRKALKVMARDIQLAVAAANLAVADSGILEAGIDPERLGTSLGAGLINSDLNELGPPVSISFDPETRDFSFLRFGRDGFEQFFPLWLLKYLPNMLACHISIVNNAQGASNSLTTLETSGLQAVAEATQIIQRGDADVMIAGAAESKIDPLCLIRMTMLGLLSQENEKPEEACRPFDRDACGSVIGEGGVVVILEEESHARARNARIYGRIAGHASGWYPGPHGSYAESAEGRARIMRAALDDARLSGPELDAIVGQGLGISENDASEARAVVSLLGEESVSTPLTTPTWAVGYGGAGMGAFALGAACAILQRKEIFPTSNFEAPIENAPICVPTSPEKVDVSSIAVTASTMTRQTACVVLTNE